MVDRIEVLTHNSIRIKDSIGTIYIDPFKIKDEPHDADFILITHQHYDHFSVEDIMKVVKDTTVLVSPESMIDDAMELERSVQEVVGIRPNETKEIAGLTIEAVPAYNNIKPFHPKRAEWVGYIFTLGGKRIYVAGDTGLTPDNKKVKCDIALVPIGGTYTMDYKKAGELINIIKPEVAIPTHYGSIVGKPADAKNFAKVVKEPTQVVEKIQYFD